MLTNTTYVHPGRAYCDQPHPGDDVEAARYCQDYHRPQGPRSVEELRRTWLAAQNYGATADEGWD